MQNKSKPSIEHHYKTVNPCRNQMEFRINCLDDLVPADHKVRQVWEFIEKMDIDVCYADIFTFEGAAGRPTTSPKIILCLWIYSIMDGNISARKIEELCVYHNIYQWIAGGASINRTMLSDFRSKNPEKFNDLLISCLGVMVKAGVLSDEDFSQDGTRVKANAGFGSFRREETLENLNIAIKTHIDELEKELKEDPKKYDERTKSSKRRAAQERSERIEDALKILIESREKKVKQAEKERREVEEEDLKSTRASTTDPEARKMKMGDGGYRLAYNIQFATGVASRVIFGVDVVNTLDPGTSPIMMQKVNDTLNVLNMPGAKSWSADAAYSSKEDINKVAELFPGCNYYSPAKLKKGIDPKKHQRGDSESVKAWRNNLDSPEMKEAYQHRCSTAEFSNAQTKNHGMTEVLVRGIEKVLAMANLHAIAQNITRFFDLISKSGKRVNANK